MKFETICNSKTDIAYFALEFLRKACDDNRLNEIENIDYVFDCLDISGDLEYAQQKLEEFHIDF
ncbi:MAG: hypothetical protein SPF87_04360 [Bacilli bacterium]|nr:hypothetical protein [Bacilli bacterium]